MLCERARPPAAAPAAARKPVHSRCHGVERVDEFAWLRAENWQAVMRDPRLLDPQIRGYLEAENAYAEASLADAAALQDTLFAEMKGRIKEDEFDRSPTPDGPFAYYVRYRAGGQHPLVLAGPRAGAERSRCCSMATTLRRASPSFSSEARPRSPDQRRLAWAGDEMGSEFFTARVRDLEDARDLTDEVPEVSGSVVSDPRIRRPSIM